MNALQKRWKLLWLEKVQQKKIFFFKKNFRAVYCKLVKGLKIY